MNHNELNTKSHKKSQNRISCNEGIRMLEEASGCCEAGSGCVHLPAPETTNRMLENLLNLILINTIRIKLGKNNAITNKRIETQRIKNQLQTDFTSLLLTCVYIQYIHKNLLSFSSLIITMQ